MKYSRRNLSLGYRYLYQSILMISLDSVLIEFPLFLFVLI